VSRPKPKVLLSKTDRSTYKTEEVLESKAIWAVFFDGKPINLKISTMASIHPGPKYKKVSFSNPGHALNLAKKLNSTFASDKFQVYQLSTGKKIN
tara:strand:+ start:2112 stop:2396 length:285 start_codon:yes stop_codon:yes gene_type:complete